MRLSGFFALVAATALGTFFLGWAPRQILSTTIFGSFIFGTLMYWRFRLAFALLGTLALLATGVLDVPHLIEFASLDVILFLISMMIIVGFLEERRFFEAVVERLLRRVLGRPVLLIAGLMTSSALAAALVDEVTSILFMSATTLEIARRFKVNPIPLVIMIVFATNIGSSATVVGNPIGVIIAFRGGLTFGDFLRWATPIAVVSLALCIPLSVWYFRKEVSHLREGMKVILPAPLEVSPLSRWDAFVCSALFLGTIAGLIFHHHLEVLLGLEKNALLVGVPAGGAGVALLIEREGARELVGKRVDWWTLAFFMLLFASVGTLRFVGVTGQIAKGVLRIGGGQEVLLLGVVTWGSGLLSAVMDNVLAVATIIPVLSDLQALNVPVQSLWWGLLFGGTFLGNATLVGSTANIVALGILERDEGRHVGFMEWLKPGLLVGVATLLLAQLLLILQLPLMR